MVLEKVEEPLWCHCMLWTMCLFQDIPQTLAVKKSPFCSQSNNNYSPWGNHVFKTMTSK